MTRLTKLIGPSLKRPLDHLCLGRKNFLVRLESGHIRSSLVIIPRMKAALDAAHESFNLLLFKVTLKLQKIFAAGSRGFFCIRSILC